jgi:hypothetical protein
MATPAGSLGALKTGTLIGSLGADTGDGRDGTELMVGGIAIGGGGIETA